MESRLSGIDAIRGLASLYIFCYHFLNNAPGLSPGVYGFFSHGILGLQLFFCMSGFLILKSFIERSTLEKKPVSNYFIRRFWRIIPLWWTLLFILYFYWYLSPSVILINMTFIFGFLSFNPYFLPVPSAWSLFVEEVYYFIFPFIHKYARSAHVWIFFILTYYLSHILLKYGPELGIPTENGFLARLPLVHLQFFFLGIIVYNIHSNESLMKRISEFNGSFVLTWLDILSLLSVVAFAYGFYFNELACFLLMLTLLTEGTFLKKGTDLSFLKWIGVRCYGIYILHIPLSQHRFLLNYFHTHFSNIPIEARIFFSMIIDFAFIALLAAISFALIEKPCLRLASRWTKMREARAAS